MLKCTPNRLARVLEDDREGANRTWHWVFDLTPRQRRRMSRWARGAPKTSPKPAGMRGVFHGRPGVSHRVSTEDGLVSYPGGAALRTREPLTNRVVVF